jgi:hypothetical protein
MRYEKPYGQDLGGLLFAIFAAIFIGGIGYVAGLPYIWMGICGFCFGYGITRW